MKHFEMKTLEFLTKLRKNNNRDWFQANKDNWTAIRNDAKSFLAELETEMNKSDVIESVKLFRINRDIRFSKDKTPYNTHISMSMKRAGAFRRGGYYLKIKPGENFMAAGFWGPETSDLKLIRAQLELDASPLKKIISSKSFKKHFGTLQGEKLKSAPRGFVNDHKDIELLKMKQFIVTKQFTDKEVLDSSFMSKLVSSYKAIRPFFDYMSDILTHDLNGTPLYKA